MDEQKLLAKDLTELNNNINPIRDYIKHSTTYLQKMHNLTPEEAKKKLSEILKSRGKRVPIIKYRRKTDTGDMVEETKPILEYMQDAIKDNEIVVPSLTTYFHPDKMKSIHAEFMQANVKKRSKYKKEAFRLKQEGNLDLSNYNNTMQKTMKIFNNSLSGAYSSKSSVLRNPSAHYTLTSITRCISSIGNSVSESFLAGNKHFRNANSLYNYITAILSNINRNSITHAINKYKLNIPTAEYIMDNIKDCTRYYWKDDGIMEDVKLYISTLDEVERVAVMYTNDFWNLMLLNQELVRNFISNVSKRVVEPLGDTNILKTLPEDIFIMVKIICANDIKGMNIEIDKIKGTDIGDVLAGTARNAMKYLQEFNYLFHTFFLTNILPIDIAYIRDMMRDVIILSDTDSTCATYEKWVEWYCGKKDMTQEGISVAAVVMTLNGRAIDHGLKILGKSMNIPIDRVDLLKMKNEFYWQVFTTANVNKHYFANTLIQEGNVFKEPELELKGVHLIASAVNQEYTKKIHQMMEDINKEIASGNKLSLLKYVKQVAQFEKEIGERVDKGDITIFKQDKIKNAKAYKSEDIDMTPYVHHLLWKEVFADKYGYPGEPPYMVIKIATTLDTKKRMDSYLNLINDSIIKEKLIKFMKEHNKDRLGTFRPPVSLISGSGIPSEMLIPIDKKRIILDNLNSAYVLLATIGFYKKTDALLTEMGY